MSLVDVETELESLHVERVVDGDVTRIRLVGTLNGSLPPEVRDRILSLVVPGCRLVLDLSGLTSVSGLGVRRLLLLFRQVLDIGSITEARDAMLAIAADFGLVRPGDSEALWTGKSFAGGMEENPIFSGIAKRLTDHPGNQPFLTQVLEIGRAHV